MVELLLSPAAERGLTSYDAATTHLPSGVPDLARDRLDHPLAAAIRLIYAARPVGERSNFKKIPTHTQDLSR